MLSKAQISLITSLQHKKFRKQHGIFIVEGIKSVLEFMQSTYQIQCIYATAEATAKLGKIPQNLKYQEVSEAELQKISHLTHPQGVLALLYIPTPKALDWSTLQQEHTLLLDDIQDPGNLGTIIRTAEWFGIRNIICSLGTVDAYNTKVVQATMGSLARIQMHYTDLLPILSETQLPTYGALLAGQSIYETDFGKRGLIVMGNEGNGISAEVIPHIQKAVTIPRIGAAESLNVAVATTIFCSEIARQRLSK